MESKLKNIFSKIRDKWNKTPNYSFNKNYRINSNNILKKDISSLYFHINNDKINKHRF